MPRLRIRSTNELAVELDDGQHFALHPIWLRERCRDPRSMDLRTGQRLHDPSDLDPALSVTAVSEPESGRYRIRFSDGHEAEFLGRHLLEEAALDARGPRHSRAAPLGRGDGRSAPLRLDGEAR